MRVIGRTIIVICAILGAPFSWAFPTPEVLRFIYLSPSFSFFLDVSWACDVMSSAPEDICSLLVLDQFDSVPISNKGLGFPLLKLNMLV